MLFTVNTFPYHTVLRILNFFLHIEDFLLSHSTLTSQVPENVYNVIDIDGADFLVFPLQFVEDKEIRENKISPSLAATVDTTTTMRFDCEISSSSTDNGLLSDCLVENSCIFIFKFHMCDVYFITTQLIFINIKL